MVRKSALLGKYCRSSPLVFSLVPRSQELQGLAKVHVDSQLTGERLMDEYEQIFDELRNAGIEIDFDGEQSEEAVQALENLLSNPLPKSYREFVKAYGFAGPEYNPYKGITKNDPTCEVGESAYYQTLVLRNEWGLPDHFLVVWYENDLRLATCIDLLSRDDDNECPIVLVEYRDRDNLDVSIEGNRFFDVFKRQMNDLISAQ